MEFPKNFYWGAATSSYQVEGCNNNADWWQWEPRAGKEPSGDACRHYELYETDFDLVKGLNHNAHRLSIEWSRIEPQEGLFSDEAVNHYVKVIKALRARGIEPMVTLHHFTNPIWFAASGGWVNKRCISRFVRYCEFVVRALGTDVRYWFTINEPTVYFSHAYLWGMWPPQKRSFLQMMTVYRHLNEAHVKAYQRIHQIYQELNWKKPAVGIAHHMQAVAACDTRLVNRFAAALRAQLYNLQLLDYLARNKSLDFIGVNYYSRHLVHAHSWWIGDLLMETCKDNHHLLRTNSLGWGIYPEGLLQVLVSLKKYNVPVLISENGICTDDDNQRWEFIQSHLENVHLAIQQGVPVIGYLYWSLMDNFEWAYGFRPRFGLIEIDYKTAHRTVRESAKKFGEICKKNNLCVDRHL
ncbi:MAG: glycoside hydrolase family 1 protein [Candidatus Omnitrophica bacterium]|nr:glycoside hydrolase family 1 protein [Candidatus Omnitrophota bacterium]